MDNLTAQIEEKFNDVYQFERLQNARAELNELQKQRQAEQLKQNELAQVEQLQAQIDSVASQIDNSVLLEISQTILKLAKLMAAWAKNGSANAQLFELIKTQIQLQLKLRLLSLSPDQILAYNQNMRVGLIHDLAKERMAELGGDVNFDIVLTDKNNQLDNPTKQWFNTIVQNIKSVLNPVSNHRSNNF